MHTREQSPRVLIVSEGLVTEREYVDEVKRSRRLRSTDVQFVPPGPTSPLEIVRRAIDLRNAARRQDPYDHVWVIFDVESKVEQHARPNCREAFQMAAANAVRVAYSNPCFELWLQLHEETQTSWISSDAVQRRCANLSVVYEKHIVDASRLMTKYGEARTRATELEKQHERNLTADFVDRNPSTSMFDLVDLIFALFPAR